jgi:AcrR family transcriptional regulator
VSIAYEQNGRVNQKQRTRTALIDAARALVANGQSPTIEEAASSAGISRTTAYRYFPNQALLLAAAHPETATTTMLPPDAPEDDVVARVDLVVAEFLKVIARTEAQQRTMLRLSLESDAPLPLRQGRAIPWISEALEPARPLLGEAGVASLARAIRSATGIESFVWLVDIGGLSRREAMKSMRWSASALCRQALAEAGGT